MECKEKELIKKYPIQIMMVSEERHKKSLESRLPVKDARTIAHNNLDKISEKNPDPETQLKRDAFKKQSRRTKLHGKMLMPPNRNSYLH